MNALRLSARVAILLLACSGFAAAAETEFTTAIQADWHAQEKRLGRQAGSVESIRLALDRSARLLDDLRAMPGIADLAAQAATLQTLRLAAANLDRLDDAQRLDLYHKIRWASRNLALRNPLVADNPLVFMKRKRFMCQMLHEYLGYYHGDMEGGGVYILQNPGQSFDVANLVQGRLGKGTYATLSLSYDAKTIYFAFTRKDAPRPDFYAPKKGDRFFQIYAMDIDGRNLRQLTDDEFDNFDPCPLPDGGLAFMSSRRGGGFIRCSNDWEPIPAYTLHRMDPDGRNIRTLSWHETNEWHPNVLNDGKIVYIRWDYVDRSAANHHGLWLCNPDGSNPVALFANYTYRINACYQPRAIPGSNKILFLAGAHHADVGGSMVILDPGKVKLDPATGEDRLDAIERLTPEVCFPEAPDFPGSYFHSPWPLSEKYYFVAFSFDRIPGGPNGKTESAGLYYFDRFGNMELLYRDAGVSCMYPTPLATRPKPPALPSMLDPSLGDEGEMVLSDISKGVLPLPGGRPIKELRIYQLLPKGHTHIANQPRVSHANADNARMLLGTVPVEPDGSAYFRAPARKPLYFQAVDEHGKAVQSMRSITYLQPGERRGCVGCHEPTATAAAPRQTLAMQRGPSSITPGPDGARPFNYVRLVQPVLDAHCVRCHDGAAGEGKSKLILTGQDAPKSPFTRSYESLKPFVKWHEWGGASIDQIVTKPGRIGTDASRLTTILGDANHKDLNLPARPRRTLYLWMDANVPFYGTYFPQEQTAQKRGDAVAEPKLQ